MRVAVFSDVHGALVALDAVLADAREAGVEEHWVAGDLVAHGPHPAATLRRLMELPNARVVRGNTDRYVLTGELSAMIPLSDADLRVSALRSFAWTRGALTAVEGGHDWLSSLPVEQTLTLPDGSRALLVHASPGQDDGPGLYAELTDSELLAAGVAEAGVQLVFVGHTHVPMDRTVAGVRVVNLGSVTLPGTAERRAMWTLIDADETGFSIERRFAEYDVGAVASALDREHHPAADWLTARLREPATAPAPPAEDDPVRR